MQELLELDKLLDKKLFEYDEWSLKLDEEERKLDEDEKRIKILEEEKLKQNVELNKEYASKIAKIEKELINVEGLLSKYEIKDQTAGKNEETLGDLEYLLNKQGEVVKKQLQFCQDILELRELQEQVAPKEQPKQENKEQKAKTDKK